ncbi:uncharacterized protein [Narcine bancroftii]|uniref:uncharacterized protein n=1 Tax=Narcine bancroftii TaxID=1343680 RepID=UPI003831593E
MEPALASGCWTPQLSNIEQIKLLNAVKNRELTVDQAWEIAHGVKTTIKEANKLVKMPENASYNFFVYKYNRYRRQKRILMIDYNSKMLCNIEKGIIKKQFPFKSIQSCEQLEGQKFSISFLIHHDYELEATSAEDGVKIIHLVNQIIQNNMNKARQINPSANSRAQKETGVIKEGQIELQKGGLASVKWNRYHMQLCKGELCFQHLGLGEAGEQLGMTLNLVYLSDGETSVHKELGNGFFTIITKKNCYLLRIPVTDQLKSMEDLRKCRDEWVDAIDRCCLHWKRLSQSLFIAENTSFEVMPVESSGKEPADQQQPSKQSENQIAGKKGKEQKEDEREMEGLKERIPTSPVEEATAKSPLQTSTNAPPLQHIPAPPILHQGPVVPIPPPFLDKKSGYVRKTKPFHWDEVAPERISKSIWGQRCAAKIQLDCPSLLDQFPPHEMVMHSVNEISSHQDILLNRKIAHNFNIFLKNFPVRVTELRVKLLTVQEQNGGLTNEQISSLRRYVPTPGDIEKYKAYKGSHSDLHIVDQYMMEMCNIPYLSQRLDLILALRELPETIDDLLPLIQQKMKACSQLQNSKLFVSVLDYLFAIGTFLNKNAGKEVAKGISLSSLPKVVLLRGKDRTFTLLHALVDQIMSLEPGLINFPQELTEFEEVPGDSIKGLVVEVDVLKNEMAKIILHKKLFKPKNKNSSDGQFYKELKSVIQKNEVELSHLSKQCDEMKKLYNDLLVKFGEPQDRDSKVMFGWISSFIKDFRKVVAERSKYRS